MTQGRLRLYSGIASSGVVDLHGVGSYLARDRAPDKKQNALIQQTELMRKEQEQIGNNLKKFNERIKTLEETQKTEGK